MCMLIPKKTPKALSIICMLPHTPRPACDALAQRHAAAWFFLFILRPLFARLGSKPRLHPIGDSLQLMLASARHTLHVTRFTPAELHCDRRV